MSTPTTLNTTEGLISLATVSTPSGTKLLVSAEDMSPELVEVTLDPVQVASLRDLLSRWLVQHGK